MNPQVFEALDKLDDVYAVGRLSLFSCTFDC